MCVCVHVRVHTCEMKINTLIPSHNLVLYIISSYKNTGMTHCSIFEAFISKGV